MYYFNCFGSVCLFLYLFRLYWKIKYVSRLQYLWDDIKKGEIEIPEFVQKHDDILENRPLTDYGIEPDPFHLTGMPSVAYSFGKYEERWAGRDHFSEYKYNWNIFCVPLVYRVAKISCICIAFTYLQDSLSVGRKTSLYVLYKNINLWSSECKFSVKNTFLNIPWSFAYTCACRAWYLLTL